MEAQTREEVTLEMLKELRADLEALDRALDSLVRSLTTIRESIERLT